jgi:hypothetical protein
MWGPRLSAAITSAVLASAGLADDSDRISKLEQENKDLRDRLAGLEMAVTKEGLLPANKPSPTFVSALTSVTISGFVQSSYFYDASRPADGESDGYLWNTRYNNFSINKFKLTLASQPVEASGDTWSAGYRVSMIWGEDAPVVDTGSSITGLDNIREAYVEMNVPVGTGLDVKVGQLISLLNYESGDGGAVNANFSQGFQWFYTGNGPSAGVQFGYTLTDWLDVKARVQNGLYAGPVDNNNGKTFMGSLGFKPTDKIWFNLIGFTGYESDNFNITGGSVLAGYKVTSKFTAGFEFDYFNFDPANDKGGGLWSIGTWLTYDFTKKVGLGLRAEFLDDPSGLGIKGIELPGRPHSAILSPDPNGNLGSVALTLTYMPVPGIRIQPEVRYDTTSYAYGFDGKTHRFIFGVGVSYLF